MPKLTPAAVLKIKPHKARREIPDNGSGLYLVVQTSGAKSWAMRFRNPHGKQKKLTLGPLDLSGRKFDDVPVIGATARSVGGAAARGACQRNARGGPMSIAPGWNARRGCRMCLTARP